ncbi:MAG: hypothetical protein L0922_01325 [Candidatus Mariimomonas ferrooxydans]
MKKAQRTKKTKSYFWYYLLAAVLIFSTSITASYLYLKPKLAFKAPFIENIESQRLDTKTDEGEENSLRLYESKRKDSSFNDELRRSALLVTAEDVIRKYMEPRSVKLLDLYMDKTGTIYADFSSELRKNFNGDAFDEYQIIADLYKRLRLNVPYFRALKILIDGKEAESLGGHIDISKPIGEKIEDITKRETNRYF